jgi:hypothetical protein
VPHPPALTPSPPSIPAGTKEMQARNYQQRKENERKRRELFDDGLVKFKSGDLQGALVDFENVVAMEPRNFVGDSGARITPILPVRFQDRGMDCCPRLPRSLVP